MGKKFGTVFFCVCVGGWGGGGVDLSRDFFGYSKQSEDFMIITSFGMMNTNFKFLMFLFFVLYHFNAYILEIFEAGNVA